nr:D-ala-D-ala dipeptidase [uncultured bacterium]
MGIRTAYPMKRIFPITACALFLTLFSVVFSAAQGTYLNKKEADLIELIKLDNTIKLDIRYAASNNFVGKPVYPEARAFLQRPAAEALLKVHKLLKKQGLGLVIFDGYRPWAITRLFWDVVSLEQRKFVADPEKGSKHNRGCAVDLSIYDLKTGALLDMPSGYDEFTERASPDYRGGTELQTKNPRAAARPDGSRGVYRQPERVVAFRLPGLGELRSLRYPVFGDRRARPGHR